VATAVIRQYFSAAVQRGLILDISDGTRFTPAAALRLWNEFLKLPSSAATWPDRGVFVWQVGRLMDAAAARPGAALLRPAAVKHQLSVALGISASRR
jgi:hypothetical protein